MWPEELVLSLAAYCGRAEVEPGEVVTHVFPFGGVRAGVRMIGAMAEGSWPSSDAS